RALGFKLVLDLSREFLPDILPGGSQLRPLLNQCVRAPGIPGSHVSGDGEQLTALLQRASGCDSGTTVFPCLHHQNAQRESADDPVANREILGSSKRLEWKFAYQCSAGFQNAVCDLLVLSGIDNVHTRPKHGDCWAFALQSSAMCCGINTPRHPAEDHQPARSQVTGETF